MSKKKIGIIIGLMSLALIGTVLLQIYWIGSSIQITEDIFDKSVRDALNTVSEKVQNEENAIINKTFLEPEKIIDESIEKLELGHLREQLLKEELTKLGVHKENSLRCDCVSCRLESYQEKFKKLEYHLINSQMMSSRTPIEQRIVLKNLDIYIKQAIEDKGIKLEYKYGVFSSDKNSFVIKDGNYVIDPIPTSSSSSEINITPKDVGSDDYILLNSKYHVSLFPNDKQPPGYLMIFFPSKRSFVWGTVWKTLLAAIIFTSIIIFCFIYTLQVINRQKKLSIMKSDFINNMTHEFKTPIATISLASDSITNKTIIGQPDKVKRFADIIRQENKRMNNQVEKVLQMAQLDKKEFELKLTQVDAHSVIKQAVELINLRLEPKGGSADMELLATNPFIQADVTHFSNVINNLLDNAFKYSPENPKIRVSTENTSSGISISVRDNGLGMSKDQVKNIFDKFYRVHTGNLHDIKGFGLGLSYVKAIVTAHKGEITVKSDLGKGSKFIIHFPFITKK